MSTFRSALAERDPTRDPAGMHVSTATEKLGEILVQGGRGSPHEQRDWATAVQERTGCRLGAILVAAGLIRRDAVYRVLARTWECEYVDLVTTPLDLSLLDGLDPHAAARGGLAPVPPRRRADPRRDLRASPPPSGSGRSERRAVFAPVKLVITTDWDILQSLHTAYRETVVDQATLGLWRRDRPAVGAADAAHRPAGAGSASSSPGSRPVSCSRPGRRSPWSARRRASPSSPRCCSGSWSAPSGAPHENRVQ